MHLLEYQPNDSTIIYKLLVKYAERARVDDALLYLRKLESGDQIYFISIRANAWLLIADAYFSLKEYDSTIEYLRHVIHEFPEADHRTAYLLLVLSYFRSIQNDAGFSALEEAIGAFPHDATFYFQFLEFSLAKAGDLEKALSLGEKARTFELVNTEKGYLCFLLAKVYKAMGKIEQARATINEAISLEPLAEYIALSEALEASNEQK